MVGLLYIKKKRSRPSMIKYLSVERKIKKAYLFVFYLLCLSKNDSK